METFQLLWLGIVELVGFPGILLDVEQFQFAVVEVFDQFEVAIEDR